MSESVDADTTVPGLSLTTALDASQARERLAEWELELGRLLGGETEQYYQTKLAAAQEALQQELTKHDAARQEHESRLHFLTREHPMRRALLDDSAAVEFIRGDLVWLRVVMLLYGGCPDLHLAGYVTQYLEISLILGLPDRTRDEFVNQLRRRPYWRQSWDGEDVFYNLAVYLDTECGDGFKAAQHASMDFDPLFICLDSVMTPFLLPRLRDRIPGKALLGPLLEMVRRGDDEMRRASALLALLALDPANAYDDLVQLSQDALSRGVMRIIQNLLEQRLSLFNDAVVLYSAASKFQAEFDGLAERYPPEKREDIVSVFYRSLCAVLPGPPAYMPLLEWSELPYVNAEVWGTWLSGASGDDPKYAFAVVLDTIGRKIRSSSALANIHRASTARFQQFTTWTLEPIPPVWDTLADMYGEALTIAHQSGSVILEELLHVGIIVFPGLGVSWEEVDDLKTDALAATLLLPEKSFRAVLSELEPTLANKSHYEIEKHVTDRVMLVSDPVVHARAFWRISRHLLHWGDSELLKAASAAAAKIAPGLQRARAYERLINDIPSNMRGGLLQKLREAIREIRDANNRVRALCRLALVSTREESEPLFDEAIKQLSSIPDDAARAETLVLMRKVLSDYQFPINALDDIAETEADPWYRHKSMDLLGFEIAGLHHALNHPADSTPVVLHAVLTDVINLLRRSQEANDAWRQLTIPKERPAAFDTILAEIARSESGMLPFDQTVYSSLGTLVADGGAALAAELLPHLVLPRGRMLPELHEWLLHPPHESFRPFANLMIAESGPLDGAIVPAVLDLLQHGKDITRYRAALVLHSDHVYIGKPDPRHRASMLGLDSILRISDFAIRMREKGRLGPANTARWTWVNVLFDHPGILSDLVGCIEGDPRQRQAASGVISSLYILSETAQSRFVDLLLSHQEGFAAEPLLKGLCSVSHPDLTLSIPEARIEEVSAYWQSLPDDLIESIRGLPDRIANVAGVIIACANDANDANELVPATTLGAALRERSISAPGSSPRDVGQCGVYWLSKDPPKAQAAAQKIAESATTLRILFAWLKAALAEAVDDPIPFFRLRDTLLEIAGYCGQYSPAAVFNLVDELELGGLLVEAAMHQSASNGRAGAVSLLGYLRVPDHGLLSALKSAMMDTAEVQQAALAMIRRLRYVNPLILSELSDLLQDDDAALAYAASRLLSVMARHEKTSDADRTSILRALSTALKGRTARHSVCSFEHFAGKMWIDKLGTLAQRHYQSLLEIVSLS